MVRKKKKSSSAGSKRRFTLSQHEEFSHGRSVPEEELDVDHSWSDFLHHVGDEVELVARAGSMRRTYTGKKNDIF